jgi:hypothetical protein
LREHDRELVDAGVPQVARNALASANPEGATPLNTPLEVAVPPEPLPPATMPAQKLAMACVQVSLDAPVGFEVSGPESAAAGERAEEERHGNPRALHHDSGPSLARLRAQCVRTALRNPAGDRPAAGIRTKGILPVAAWISPCRDDARPLIAAREAPLARLIDAAARARG